MWCFKGTAWITNQLQTLTPWNKLSPLKKSLPAPRLYPGEPSKMLGRKTESVPFCSWKNENCKRDQRSDFPGLNIFLLPHAGLNIFLLPHAWRPLQRGIGDYIGPWHPATRITHVKVDYNCLLPTIDNDVKPWWVLISFVGQWFAKSCCCSLMLKRACVLKECVFSSGIIL